jgi:hypothetical protein
MSGSFVHKIIIAGCRCFASPLTIRPLTKRTYMRIARQRTGPERRRHRSALIGLVVVVLLLFMIFSLLAQRTRSEDGSVSPATTLVNEPDSTTVPSSTVGTREEVVARLQQIFRIRDISIETRNPLLLEDIYTVDCPCLKGDQQLIGRLKEERLRWRGIKVSLDIQEVERVNDRLWIVNALIKTSSFKILRESGATVREVPPGQEYSRFALAKPIGQESWLLGQASVIEEHG